VVRLYDEIDSFLHRSSGKGEHAKSGRFGMEPPSTPSEIERLVGDAKRWLVRTALAHPQGLGRALDALVPRAHPGCLLILGFEGSSELTRAEADAAASELERAGATDLGEAPGLRWFERRYKVSFQQSKIFENGAFVDTMEVAATWDRLMDLYAAVRGAIGRHALVMAHFSHAYAEGCSIYFTFVAAGRDRADAERRYDTIWRAGLTAALAAGGVLSHHHGIGMSKQRYMPEELGAGMDLYRAMKRVLDPHGILNPGKMGLEVV
jgi:alkyldihydroxyacetonephosphate synthase